MGVGHGSVEDVVTTAGAYRGRRVFVTGHSGFKGSWLAYWLARSGADVTGYALDPPTEPSLFETLRLGQLVRHVVADVRDGERLRDELVAAAPEIVFHLAAQPIVREGYARPAETFEVNVMGTVNLLEAVRAGDSARAVVVVTSDKCYRNDDQGRPFAEDDPLGGRDPYSASKGCAELVTSAYATAFLADRGVQVASARAGNVIGGGDWAADRILPDCVRALAAGRPVEVRSPDAVRPWQHVLEPLRGYLVLGAKALEGADVHGAWNFGPDAGDALSVRWVAERFLEEWGEGSWETAGRAGHEPREAAVLTLDSAKAARELAWAPVWDAGEAVRRTAAWYHRQLLDPASARALVDEDLDDYAAAVAAREGAP